MKLIKSIVVTKKKILCAIGGIVAFVLAIQILPNKVESVFHTAQAERKLPIYCVDTPEKKVSISFDAAWGAYDIVRRSLL